MRIPSHLCHLKLILRHQHLDQNTITSDFQGWAATVAVISFLIELHNIILQPNRDGITCGRCFFGVEFKQCLEVGVSKFANLHAFCFKLQILEQESADFQRRQGDIFPEDFIEDLILLSEIGHCLPVPLGVNEVAVLHVSTQCLFTDAAEADCPSVESSEQWRAFVGINSYLDGSLVVHVLDSEDSGGVVERTDAEFKVIDVTCCVPFVPHLQISNDFVYFFVEFDSIALNEQGLVMSSLNPSFVIVCILDSNHMSVLLVLAPYIALIHPLAIVFTQSIEVDPKCSLSVGCDTLWSLQVDGDFIIIILEVDKSSGWIAVSIKIIVLLLAEKCLIILMLEHLSIHSQPTIGICHKFVAVIDRSDDLEVKILKMIALSCCNRLNLPLVRSGVRNADKGFHLVALPMYEEESVTITLQLRD